MSILLLCQEDIEQRMEAAILVKVTDIPYYIHIGHVKSAVAGLGLPQRHYAVRFEHVELRRHV